MIEKQEVIKISKLSNLSIEEEKIDKFQEDFSSILDYISELKEVDTEDVEEMSYSIDIKSVEREDVPSKYEGESLITKNKDDYLVVKRVLNHD